MVSAHDFPLCLVAQHCFGGIWYLCHDKGTWLSKYLVIVALHEQTLIHKHENDMTKVFQV